MQTLEHILATEENPGNHKTGKKSDTVFCVTYCDRLLTQKNWFQFKNDWKLLSDLNGSICVQGIPKQSRKFFLKILLLQWKEETAWQCRDKARDPGLGATLHSTRLELIFKNCTARYRSNQLLERICTVFLFTFYSTLLPYFTISIYPTLFQ